MTPLFPPSSRSARPSRAATRDATAFPVAIEPVNEISGTRGSSQSQVPTSAPPATRLNTPSAPCSFAARSHSACTAALHRGVSGEGFQRQTSPQTAASAAFHDQTATGKLKAVTIPTAPSGCHCSISRCCGRSEAMVRP